MVVVVVVGNCFVVTLHNLMTHNSLSLEFLCFYVSGKERLTFNLYLYYWLFGRIT